MSRIPPRWRLWGRRIALGVVGLYAVYLIAGNLFLNTPIGEWTANRKPEKFHIEWGPGVTWWPGRVTVWDVKLGGQAGRTRWAVQADKASGRVAILPLLHKEVRVPDVTASGVTGDVDTVGARRPPPVARPGGWILNFQRIRSDSIRGGRYAGLVLEGDGRAEVGFYKQLRGGALELMPSTAHFDRARLSVGKQELLSEGRIDAHFAIARHTRAQASGIRKLVLTDASLELQGKVAALRTGVDAAGKMSFATVPGQGTANAKIGFARGTITPGSTLRWHMPITGKDVSGHARAGALDVGLDAGRDLHVTARSPAQADNPLSLDADLVVRGTQIPLQDPRSLLPRSSGHVVGRWQFSSLRWLGAFFTDATWLSLDGAGLVDADLRVVDGRVAVGSRVSVPEVEATAHVMGNRIRGRARAEGRLDGGKDGEPLPSLELVMERFNIAADDAPDRPYVDGRDLRLSMQTVKPFRREQLKQADAMQRVREALKARLTFSNAHVPDLRAHNRYLPQQHLRFDGGSGTLSGDLTLDGAGDVGTGSVRIGASNARMHVAGLALRGNIDVDTPLRRADLTGHSFNIDGTRVGLTGISFTEPSGESRSGWWARIQLERARMDWDRPISIDARANVTMKDVGFLLSLFSKQREYPKWVYKMIDSGQAQVGANIRWKGETLVLDRVVASNQRYDLKARLKLRGKSRTGSLYAKWGLLSCAVGVNNGQRDFHLVRAQQWYDSQPDLR
ncbi:hypothetical protein QLQ15_11960 [Lysobacter sp. LF1]|uniref:Translocation/assembly module TamB n=1 Tax=Lysobacter stagni TaxID=3045172 RepID=A0ABT6XHI1_9GAMM|nr:hypothetical protein [Lysobacter sp. LF1]MDI9239619.1 hypothetical protein [Lysobacter sp. LF1]